MVLKFKSYVYIQFSPWKTLNYVRSKWIHEATDSLASFMKSKYSQEILVLDKMR